MKLTLEEARASDYPKIKKLFLSAFPPEERPPFFIMQWRAKRGKGQMLAARDGETFVGFAYLICHEDLAYLFFLAIEDDQRGMGYGSAILKALRERCKGKRLFLAREQLDEKAPNYAQRVRRHSFYLRSGFADLPCRIQEGGVVFDAMGIGGNITAADYDKLVTAWGGKLWKWIVGMKVLE